MTDDPPHTTILTDAPSGELPVGTLLNAGQYRIKRLIASGGFGITYLAEDNLGRDVALKECFPLGLAMRSAGKTVGAASTSTAESFGTARNLFLREARLLASLHHPNVVHVQTLFEENGTAYMAMDFIHGHDLHTVITTYPERLTPDRVLELARTLLRALAYLHKENLLHRDIKPSNIRIDRFGTPVLIDFGAARQETQMRSRLAGSFRVVSDGYSPNEFYISGAGQGPGSDLYSLAATLYHAIAGRAPAQADARAQQVATGEPDPYQPLSGRHEGFDPRLLQMIDRAMAMSLKDRPASAEVWLDAIAEDLAPAPTALLAAQAAGPAPAGGSRFWPGLGLGAVAGALLAGAAVVAMPGLMPGGDAVPVTDSALQAALDAAETGRAEAETALAAATARLAEIEAALTEAEAAQAAAETAQAAAETALAAAQTATPADAARLAELETALAAAETAAAAAETARTRAQAEVTRLNSALAASRTEIASLQARLAQAQIDAARNTLPDPQPQQPAADPPAADPPAADPADQPPVAQTAPDTTPPATAANLPRLVGTWSVVAQCSDDYIALFGTSRFFGTLLISGQTGATLTAGYRNNIGQTATLSGQMEAATVNWTLTWDEGSTSEMTMILNSDYRTFTGTDSNACQLSGSLQG
jgi:hypothetical protein